MYHRRALAFSRDLRHLAGPASLSILIPLTFSLGIRPAEGRADPPPPSANGGGRVQVANYDIYRQLADRRAVCGNNALYVILRLGGWDVDYDSVQSAIGGDSLDGKSLMEIRRACERLAIPAVVLKSPIEELQSCDFPILVYGSPGRPFSGRRAGQKHFVVVLGIEDEEAYYVDPTNAEIIHASCEWLLGQGGHFYWVKIDQNQRLNENIILLATLCASSALASFFYFRRRRGRIAPARIPGNAAFVLLLLAAVLHPGPSFASQVRGNVSRNRPAEDPSARIWRRPECDGLNALYLLMRARGVEVDYGDLSEKLGGCEKKHSLRDLRDMARQFGLEATIANVDLRDPPRGCLPAIVLLDNDREKGSHFALVCGNSAGEVEYLDGGFVTWNKDDVDEFIRKWRGPVLYVGGEKGVGSSPNAPWIAIVAIPALYLAARLGWNSFRRRGPIATGDPGSAGSPPGRLEGTSGGIDPQAPH